MIYFLREGPTVPDEVMDPLLPSCYYGQSRSLISELESLLSHSVPIFKNENSAVYAKIKEATRGISVESTIKYFSHRKDGHGAFQAMIRKHAGDVKNPSILKKMLNLLQNIKWNGWARPLKIHVSNHSQAHDDLMECSLHIECAVPGPEKKVECLIDSITCTDSTLQAFMGLVRANNNNMREDFEALSSYLIEVDPYRR